MEKDAKKYARLDEADVDIDAVCEQRGRSPARRVCSEQMVFGVAAFGDCGGMAMMMGTLSVE